MAHVPPPCAPIHRIHLVEPIEMVPTETKIFGRMLSTLQQMLYGPNAAQTLISVTRDTLVPPDGEPDDPPPLISTRDTLVPPDGKPGDPPPYQHFVKR
ncbi:hypothetical protein FRC00_009068, partial [Tulasnella sp. 408]